MNRRPGKNELLGFIEFKADLRKTMAVRTLAPGRTGLRLIGPGGWTNGLCRGLNHVLQKLSIDMMILDLRGTTRADLGILASASLANGVQ